MMKFRASNGKRIHYGAFTPGYSCGRGEHHFVNKGKYSRCSRCGATKTH